MFLAILLDDLAEQFQIFARRQRIGNARLEFGNALIVDHIGGGHLERLDAFFGGPLNSIEHAFFARRHE